MQEHAKCLIPRSGRRDSNPLASAPKAHSSRARGKAGRLGNMARKAECKCVRLLHSKLLSIMSFVVLGVAADFLWRASAFSVSNKAVVVSVTDQSLPRPP
jgi:hypothetical protein